MAANRMLWDWRSYFNRSVLFDGEKDYRAGKMVEFTVGADKISASGVTAGGFVVEVKSVPQNFSQWKKYPRWDRLYTGSWYTGDEYYGNYYQCSCAQGRNGSRCRHLVNLMLCWEAAHGPFIMEESEEEHRARLEQERAEKEKARKQQITRRVDEYFGRRSASRPTLYFNPDTIMGNARLETNQFEIDEAHRLLADHPGTDVELEIVYEHDGSQNLVASCRFDAVSVRLQCDRKNLRELRCSCGRSQFIPFWYGEKRGRMCAHALALWSLFREKVARENPGDNTDAAGSRLLTMLMSRRAMEEDAEDALPPVARRENIQLRPRIVQDRLNDAFKLSFDMGYAGGKLYALRKYRDFVRDAENGGVFNITSKQSVDFNEGTFTEESAKWYRLIADYLRNLDSLNARLRTNYGYAVRDLTPGDGITLEGRDLDQVYALAEGGELLYQYGARNETCVVPVHPASARAEVTLSPVMSQKALTAVQIEGDMPRLLEGNGHQYILDKSCFGKVEPGGMDALGPFRALVDASGHFSAVVGNKKFAEFYHRVLPILQNNRQITLNDQVSGLLEAIVPPAPEFTFYIDLTDVISCRIGIEYPTEDGVTPVPDVDQERRVQGVVREYFPRWDEAHKYFYNHYDDDTLLEILIAGTAALSAYGEIKGSDAFRRVHVRQVSQPRISLRVDGGLLDLSIQTRDYTQDELLELLNSYRLKRHWHRLKSGDFVDLRGSDALEELADTVESMDVDPETLIREGVKVPKYRALYVDRLLEAHEEIVASRDRQFKALIRSFQTIRDSDFEVSDQLSDILRPYQVYGFRWLCTLAQSGFGGILADEMGLGKTLQLLAFIDARRAAGETRPSLVVCPASLVYNWREECRHFTPDLTVETLDGNLSTRKKLIAGIGGENHALLYITSYDQLKRDIALYDALEFATVALDEAQYVKNQRTAVSKAVRVLKAEHRFALTGTPIENRLSELWSIFDFLMPGFLYSSQEFASRFETPIMKQKDPAATTRLARMTEPFILRRKKADVLKDLPDKLEETRASAMEPDQRRLYDAEVVRMRELLEASGDSNAEKMRILAEITRLRQLCCDPSLVFEDYKGSSAKRAACVELIQNARDAGHRMLVFSQFTSMLDLLAADLKREDIPFYTITGSTPKQERLRLVNAFNEGDVPVFLISLKAGGTGLNLTGADVVIHYDPWWNLAVQNQATDRAHRIGQTREVTVIRLIAAETIEDRIIQLQEAKRELAESIISSEGGSLMSFTRDELLALLG